MAWWVLAAYAASAVMDANAKKEEGAQTKVGNYFNAAVEEQNAVQTRTAAAMNDYQKRKALEYGIGRQRSAYAAGGVVVNTGSPLDAMVDSLSNSYLDIAIDNYNYEVAARGHENRAKLDRYAGDVAEDSGNSNAMTSLLKSGTNILAKTKIGQ